MLPPLCEANMLVLSKIKPLEEVPPDTEQV